MPPLPSPGAAHVALVTGGARGIGAAVARFLAARGSVVVVADRADAAGTALAREISGSFVHCDVADPDDMGRAVDHAVSRHGGLDLVHLNAGVSSGTGIRDGFDLEEYRRAMGVNVDGVVFGLVAALPALRARGGGDVVATASLAGLVGTPFDPIYGLTKHAVVGFVRSVGPDLAGEGIRVQALCPGFARTAIIEGFEEQIAGFGVPLLELADVVEAFGRLLGEGAPGQCWFVQPGRPSAPFEFRRVPGPRAGSADR